MANVGLDGVPGLSAAISDTKHGSAAGSVPRTSDVATEEAFHRAMLPRWEKASKATSTTSSCRLASVAW